MHYCYVNYMIEMYADNRIKSFVLFEQWFQIYYWILWLVGVWWVWGGRVSVDMGKKSLSGKMVGGG